MNNYPFEITLKDNTKIQISDFKKEHKESIKRLLYKIPDEDILVFLDNEIDKDSIDWFVNPEFKKVSWIL
ncbi:MAG: hypothetical protein GTO02_17360 [Candidatus Dadabacteria bacterium]|nr:hypothetical protein [Candidatus Dadabacteria bacterium]